MTAAVYALTALGVLWTALLIVRGPDALRHRSRPDRPLLVPAPTGRAGVAPPERESAPRAPGGASTITETGVPAGSAEWAPVAPRTEG